MTDSSIEERWKEKYYDKVEELRLAEAHIETLSKALRDIKAHAKEPFLGPKWARYIYEVAEEALQLTKFSGRENL